MSKFKGKKLKSAVFCAMLCSGLLLGTVQPALAATKAQYEYSMVNEGETVYKGIVNREALNVRKGASTDYSIIKDADGNDVQLKRNDEIAILDRKYDGDDVWYHVTFVRDGEFLEGYVFAEYVERSNEVVAPRTTPTPVPTEKPTPTPRPTKEPTPVPTAAPIPTVAPDPVDNKDGGKGTVVAIVVVLIIIVGGIAGFWYMKNSMKQYEDDEEENEDERYRRANARGPLSKDGTPIHTTRRRNSDDEEITTTARRAPRAKQDEVSVLADKERARKMNEEMIRQYRNGDIEEDEEELKKIAATLKEKEVLKEEIDSLHIGDMVYHEYFGKGIVRDNSDVKVIEISFGQDIRFLNKASCASKRLLRKI